MTLLRLTLILLLGSILTLTAETRDPDALFFEANVLAAESSFAEAIPLYETALAQKPSVNLHYNLGNAYYHTGDWGRARIHWERTLAIAPRHSAARQNLQLLLQEQNLSSSPPGIGTSLANLLSRDQWTWIAALAFWLILAGILAARWRKAPRFLIISALATAGFATSLIALLFVTPALNDAILLENHASLRLAPAPASPVKTTLPAAQHIRIIETYGDYLRVRLPDGQEGFLQAHHLERIR